MIHLLNMRSKDFDNFHLLDADVWKEVEDRKIQENGYVYVGRKYKKGYEVKMFIKKLDDL